MHTQVLNGHSLRLTPAGANIAVVSERHHGLIASLEEGISLQLSQFQPSYSMK
jgi:hypothetical protein